MPPTPARPLPSPQSYAGIAWSTWMVSIAILWAPFWFNPQTFQARGRGPGRAAGVAGVAGAHTGGARASALLRLHGSLNP